MMDVGRFIGLVICIRPICDLNLIKEALARLTSQLEPQDIVVINDNYCRGPGEATGTLLNIGPMDRAELSNILKINFHTIGGFNNIATKDIFLITDFIDLNVEWTLKKLEKINHSRMYDCCLHVVRYPVENLYEEVERLLDEKPEM